MHLDNEALIMNYYTSPFLLFRRFFLHSLVIRLKYHPLPLQTNINISLRYCFQPAN